MVWCHFSAVFWCSPAASRLHLSALPLVVMEDDGARSGFRRWGPK
jgi:hypothetical protein